MSKKFRKLLFFSAAAASAAAAVCYFVRKKESAVNELEEDDYDDFSDDTEKDHDNSGSYVPLSPDTAEEASDSSDPKEIYRKNLSPQRVLLQQLLPRNSLPKKRTRGLIPLLPLQSR